MPNPQQLNTPIQNLSFKRLQEFLKETKQRAETKSVELEDLDRLIAQIRKELRNRRK